MEKGDLVLLVINSLPSNNKVRNLDLVSESDAIRFSWGGKMFRVSDTLNVDEIEGNFLITGTNETSLIERLLKIMRNTGA